MRCRYGGHYPHERAGNFYHVTNSNFSEDWIKFTKNVPMRDGAAVSLGVPCRN